MMMKPVTNGDDGTILVLAALLITALSLVGIAATQNVAIDTAISSSHLSSVQSFYIAEAGLERGKLEASQRLISNDWVTFTPLLSDPGAGPSSGELTFGSETSFQGGSYEVTVANDPGDQGLGDTNRAITITSTGKFGGSTSTVRTTIRMNTVPPLPGSVNLVGDAGVSIRENFTIVDGHNHNLEGNRDTSVDARLGVSVSDIPAATRGAKLAAAVAGIKFPENVGGSGGTPSLAYREALTADEINRIVAILKGRADYTNSYTFGASTDTPRITYFSDGDVSLNRSNCPNGAGIIVVDGRNVTVEGGVGWKGLMIVKGGFVTFEGSKDGTGGESSRILGGLIATGIRDTGSMLEGSGTIRSLYSKAALAVANQAIMGAGGKWEVLSWQRVK